MTPRRRLVVAWAELERRGAVVRRVRLDDLTSREQGALAEHCEHRLRVLAEGRECGWVAREAS